MTPAKKRLNHPGRMIILLFTALIVTSSFLMANVATAIASDAAAVKGKWRTHNGEIVHFYSCGAQLCGKLMSAPKDIRQDKNNPNPKLRARSVKGLTIIKSGKKIGPYNWAGTVYNVRDGKTYKGSLELVEPAVAKLTGCQSGFCQSALWHKIGGTRVSSLDKEASH